MAMTAQVKSELLGVVVKRPSNRAAETAAILRLAATIDVDASGAVSTITVDLDDERLARRVRRSLFDLYDAKAVVVDAAAAPAKKRPHYQVVITQSAAVVARRSGMVLRSGTQVVGLPPQVISGTVDDAEAVWRGAFLVRGTLIEPGRSSCLEVSCPCPEVAMALVGCARRLGVTAKSKQTRGCDRVVVRDGEAIGALLTRMGAQKMRLRWEDKRMHREVRATANRLATFDDANLRRSARAAVAAAARVERALSILGDDVPEHLAEAGELRIAHKQASLEELGKLAVPQMTKDAVAGRIRRLLSMADKRAKELGVATTEAAITPEVLAQVDNG